MGVQLLADLRKVFRDAGDPASMPTDKHGELHGGRDHSVSVRVGDSPGSEGRRKPLTPRSLAALLKPFGIASVYDPASGWLDTEGLQETGTWKSIWQTLSARRR